MALTLPTTYYVQLNGKGGFKLMTVTGVASYSREIIPDLPDYLYRDSGFGISPSSNIADSSSVVAVDGQSSSMPSSYRNPDEVEHEPPRQATKDRYAHVFKDDTSGTPLVCGFFWDDYVIGVTVANS